MNTEKALVDKVLELERTLAERNNDLHDCKKQTMEFIHIASHDLQAPLRRLSTFVERLVHKSSDALGDDALSYIPKIENTINAMRSLVDGLSALSLVSSSDNDFKMIDLNNVLGAATRDLSSLIKGTNVAIKAAALPVIEANTVQIKTVFKHLISNSIKFRKEDRALQIVITEELVLQEEKIANNLTAGKIYHKLMFTDNGIGFKPEYASRIFSPFQRLHGKSTYKGNGLGLATCKKIINKHKGIMYATGIENSGAVFILILPSTQKS